MATNPDYKAFVLELLSPIYPVTARNMFGGVGIYADDLMCALITSDDELFFKADDTNRADYEAANAEQFMRMPYFAVPAEILEDQEQLELWLDKSIEAAKHMGKPKKNKKKT